MGATRDRCQLVLLRLWRGARRGANEQGDEDGCGVQMVSEGSAADKAGIKAGDLIVKLAGEDIEDVRAYSDVLGGLKIGEKVKVVVMRGGKRLELDVTVGESRR